MGQNIIGIGYQGYELETFLDKLEVMGVTSLVDVRLNPISRKRGFSKTLLATGLASKGITYVHLRRLGNPKDNRNGFWQPGTSEAAQAHQTYRSSVLESAEGRVALEELSELSEVGLVAVMCFEADQACCHRSLVLEAVENELIASGL